MFTKINLLRQKGYVPDTILDIGAYHGYWTRDMKGIYPHANYHLFEAIEYQELTTYRHDKLVNVYHLLLNDKIEQVKWYEMKNTGDSIFKEKTYHFKDCEGITRDTVDLNTVISQRNLFQDAQHFFMKIDCQGAEIPILKGATSILEKTDFIVLEVPLFGQYNEGVPTFLEHVEYMNSIGFVVYDILESHYIHEFNMQIDMMFINKNHPFNRIVNESLA
jgi:FkbM family methyltransferase